MPHLARLSSAAAFLVALAAAAPAQAQYTFTPFGGHWYTFTQQATDWSAAESEANALGGHLTSVQSGAENAFVRALGDATAGGASVWIGLAPPYTAWTDGSAFDFTSSGIYRNFNQGEPNGCCGGPLAVQMYGVSGFGPYASWDDTDATSAFYGAIELTADPNSTTAPEPASLALVATGLLALGAHVRRRRTA